MTDKDAARGLAAHRALMWVAWDVVMGSLLTLALVWFSMAFTGVTKDIGKALKRGDLFAPAITVCISSLRLAFHSNQHIASGSTLVHSERERHAVVSILILVGALAAWMLGLASDEKHAWLILLFSAVALCAAIFYGWQVAMFDGAVCFSPAASASESPLTL
jgi:hypothetical protein